MMPSLQTDDGVALDIGVNEETSEWDSVESSKSNGLYNMTCIFSNY